MPVAYCIKKAMSLINQNKIKEQDTINRVLFLITVVLIIITLIQ